MYSCSTKPFYRNKSAIPAILAIPALFAYSCIGGCIHVQLNLSIEIKVQFLQFLPIPAIPALFAYSYIG
jgi:sorbitol-specific phosphotransferase system component IIBC